MIEWSVPVTGPIYPAEGTNRPRYIIIHHSLTDINGRVFSAQKWASIFDQYHRVTPKGPVCCPYHLIISPEGGVARGRDIFTRGGHAGSRFNGCSVGICIVGNYDVQPMSSNTLQVVSLLMVTTDLMAALDIPLANVLGHREAQALVYGKALKTCPGRNFDMDMLRACIG